MVSRTQIARLRSRRVARSLARSGSPTRACLHRQDRRHRRRLRQHCLRRPLNRQRHRAAWLRARQHPVRQVFLKVASRACLRRHRRDRLPRHGRAAVVTVRGQVPAKRCRAGRAGQRRSLAIEAPRPRSGRRRASRRRLLLDRLHRAAVWENFSPACSVGHRRRHRRSQSRRPSRPRHRHGRRRSRIGLPARRQRSRRRNLRPLSRVPCRRRRAVPIGCRLLPCGAVRRPRPSRRASARSMAA